MNKLIEIFFNLRITFNWRYKHYLEDIKIIDDRYPNYLGMPAEAHLYKDKLKEDSRKYWRIFT